MTETTYQIDDAVIEAIDEAIEEMEENDMNDDQVTRADCIASIEYQAKRLGCGQIDLRCSEDEKREIRFDVVERGGQSIIVLMD